MEMTLLSITVWFTQFLIASALYFNTLPANTQSDYAEITQITPATTKTNPEPGIFINATSSSPLTATTQENITNLPSEVHTLPNITPNVTLTQETASLYQDNSTSPSQNDMMDDGVSIAMSHAITSHATVSPSFARLTPQKDDSSETGTMSSMSYSYDGHTDQTADTLSDSVNSVSTAPWRHSTEKEDERTKADEGNYETNSTQATFANTNEELRETRGTAGTYNFTSEHREEQHYDTAANTTDVSATTATGSNQWSVSPNTDVPTTTPAYTTAQDLTVTDVPEYHTSTDGVKHSTTPQSIHRFTNSTAPTGRENRTGTDTPGGTTTNSNISVITDVLTDFSLNATTNRTNKTDTENKAWPACLNPNPESHSRQSRLVCFITLWALAMIATIFLGITIFLLVRLSVFKKKMKRRVKGGQKCEKESLWADPKASVQERVEFWYINGSTLEADRKEKDRRKEKRMKGRGQDQENEENGLWIQPRVTVDDITEFWYANRRIKEERMQDLKDDER